MASLAFQDDYTKERGVAFFVSVEPVFSEQVRQSLSRPLFSRALSLTLSPCRPPTVSPSQIAEAVTFIARARPENVRVSYISQFSAAAKLAAPIPEVDEDAAEEELDEDKEDKKVEEDSDETREAKRKVFRDMVASVKGLRIDGADREYEGYSNLILSLLFSLFSTAHPDFPTLVLALVDSAIFSQDKTVFPSLAARYMAVATLFNTLPVPTPSSSESSNLPASLRLSVLLKLIAYASANDDFAVIRPALAKFESWLIEWGFGPGTSGEEEGNAAVLQVVTTLAAKGQKVEARTLLLSHLSAPSAVAGKSITPSSSAAALATQVIVLSLALPDVFDVSSLSTLPSVSSPSVPELKMLLDIFQSGDVAAFEAFAKSNAQVLADHKLNPSVLERKLKLLALAELCSKRVGELVAYSEIATALRLASSASDDGEEVETWVIDAIRATLISGRLSQPLLSFHVTRAAPRSFTPAHWTQLQSRLEGWRTSLDAILDSVSKGLSVGSLGAIEVREHASQQAVTA
ncbi:translation initiation factor 3 subunit M, partial [Phenoliferia sp. Uapishka_3]